MSTETDMRIRSGAPLLLRPSGSVAPGPDGLLRSHDAAELDELLAFHNQTLAKCKLSRDEDGQGIVFGAGCVPRDHVQSRRPSFSFMATGRHITVTSGLLQTLKDEEQTVAILAHELGHFYRAHANTSIDVLNYFYDLDTPAGTKPAPDPRFTAETAALRDKLRPGYVSPTDFADENRLMQKHHLGFYTAEQEADEIGLELLAEVGIAPSVAVDMLFALPVWPVADGVTKPECEDLRARGWKDEAGAPVSVPVGNPIEPHHDQCFRIFNVDREIDAHRYELREGPTPPGDEWSTLIR
jgi:hypothetical protein